VCRSGVAFVSPIVSGVPVNRIRIPFLLCLLLAVPAHAARPLGEVVVATGDSTEMDWSSVPEYRIVPGDLLMLNFGPQENLPNDLNKPARVRPDGRISVFPVGDVVAAGHTPRELESALVDLLAAEYKNPRVTVEVHEVAGNKVHVLGQVKNPGSYNATPFMTTLEAITAAGGFMDDAARNSVIVFHRDGARTMRVARLRIHDALKSGALGVDMPLSRFDIVYVPRSAIGNLNVFTRQFIEHQLPLLNGALLGWELFNLDRVFVVPGPR
jgi:protein involved in polysaccharide export with SLBB domain